MSDITEIRINHIREPKGVAGLLSVGWMLASDRSNVMQESYRLQLAGDKDFAEMLYDTGKVASGASQNIVVDTAPLGLVSLHYYYVRVKVTDNYGGESAWACTRFLTPVLPGDSLRGDFITAEQLKDKNHSPATRLRREFEITKPVREAFLAASAHGLYQTFLNGGRVGQEELAPGWTSYNKRLLYQIYEVTDLLVQGTNAWAALVGAGWYKGDVSYYRIHNFYGEYAAFFGELIIRYEDGSEERICTDESWRGADSAILFADIYDGETYDARLEREGSLAETAGQGFGAARDAGMEERGIHSAAAEQGFGGLWDDHREADGWKRGGFSDDAWRAVRTVAQEKEKMHPQPGAAVRVQEVFPVSSLVVTPKGESVLDFGQNLSGWVEFQVSGKSGDEVELVFFETPDAEGNVYTDNLRTAKQTIRYICKGGDVETYRPHFTFQGFRYVWVKQYPGELCTDCFRALALYSDMKEAGTFSCSEPLLNRLQSNILWGLKGNSVDVPSDCPQRDERLGWTGDVQVFCSTACYLMDMYEFYRKWLLDLSADQQENGAVTNVVPEVLGANEPDRFCGASGWGDAAVVLPWVLYQETGDTAIIAQQYGSMKAWIDFLLEHMEDGIYSFGSQFGDWLALDAEEGSYHGATPAELTGAAYFAYVSGLFAGMAKALGYEEDAGRYGSIHEEAVRHFQGRYFLSDGRMSIQTQTAHVLALSFGLLPEAYREQTIQGLLALLLQRDMHLSTGFLGTPFLMHAISESGHLTEAYELLLKKDFPSWLYQVKQGATTVWEHWDGKKPDGSMWSEDMNSFNHYAYGSIGKWLYEVCGGLKRDEKQPGYRHFYVEPQPGGGLTYAETSHETGYGRIAVRWEREGDEMTLHVEIPPNTTASIVLSQVLAVTDRGGLDFIKKERGFTAESGSGSITVRYRIG
ncbi:family 78 glycoside hydrolase catalytic domain [Lachnospiraceae bacterium 47-T17]